MKASWVSMPHNSSRATARLCAKISVRRRSISSMVSSACAMPLWAFSIWVARICRWRASLFELIGFRAVWRSYSVIWLSSDGDLQIEIHLRHLEAEQPAQLVPPLDLGLLRQHDQVEFLRGPASAGAGSRIRRAWSRAGFRGRGSAGGTRRCRARHRPRSVSCWTVLAKVCDSCSSRPIRCAIRFTSWLRMVRSSSSARVASPNLLACQRSTMASTLASTSFRSRSVSARRACSCSNGIVGELQRIDVEEQIALAHAVRPRSEVGLEQQQVGAQVVVGATRPGYPSWSRPGSTAPPRNWYWP